MSTIISPKKPTVDVAQSSGLAIQSGDFDSLRSSSESISWRHYVYKLIAAEISKYSRYYDRVVQWAPTPMDSGLLLSAIDNQNKSQVQGFADLPDLSQESQRAIVLMNGTLNYELDIQSLLLNIKTKLARGSRLAVVGYNPYFSWLYKLANFLGLRKGEVPCTFLTGADVNTLARLSGFEVVRSRPAAYCPLHLFGLGDVINQVLPSVPLLKWFSRVCPVSLHNA